MPNFKVSNGDRIELLLDWDSTEDLKFLVGMANTLLDCKLRQEKPSSCIPPEVPERVPPCIPTCTPEEPPQEEPAKPEPAVAPAIPAASPSKHQLCWTPERRKALAERMRGNHIRRDSTKPSAEKPAADPPLANDASGKDYRSPNSVWKGTEVPAP